MNRSKRYSLEIRERAVRMVFEHQSEYESEWAAMCSISSLSKAELWREIQGTVRREVGEEPAGSDQGGPKLTFQLWQIGLIVDAPA